MSPEARPPIRAGIVAIGRIGDRSGCHQRLPPFRKLAGRNAEVGRTVKQLAVPAVERFDPAVRRAAVADRSAGPIRETRRPNGNPMGQGDAFLDELQIGLSAHPLDQHRLRNRTEIAVSEGGAGAE